MARFPFCDRIGKQLKIARFGVLNKRNSMKTLADLLKKVARLRGENCLAREEQRAALTGVERALIQDPVFVSVGERHSAGSCGVGCHEAGAKSSLWRSDVLKPACAKSRKVLIVGQEIASVLQCSSALINPIYSFTTWA